MPRPNPPVPVPDRVASSHPQPPGSVAQGEAHRSSPPGMHLGGARRPAPHLAWGEPPGRGGSACSGGDAGCGAGGAAERIAVPSRRRTSLRGPAPRAAAFMGCGPGPAVNQRRRGAPPARCSAAVTRPPLAPYPPPAAPSPPGRPLSPTCEAAASPAPCPAPPRDRPAEGRCGRRDGPPGAKGERERRRGSCGAPESRRRVPRAAGSRRRGLPSPVPSGGGRGERLRPLRPGPARPALPGTSVAQGSAQPSPAPNPLVLSHLLKYFYVTAAAHRLPWALSPCRLSDSGFSSEPQHPGPSWLPVEHWSLLTPRNWGFLHVLWREPSLRLT